MRPSSRLVGWILAAVAVAACSDAEGPAPTSGDAQPAEAGEVVLYSSLNEPTARSVLSVFEEQTGIKVLLQGDTERDKTVGLVQTLIEEKSHPRADVFWNSEVANSVRLSLEGVLEPFSPAPPEAERIPPQYKDPGNHWFGFAARARVFIVNTDLVPKDEYPQSMWDLLDPKWKGKAAIVRPVTGTTLTHVTTLYEVLGEEKTNEFLDGVVKNELNLPPGNGRCAKLVGEGQIHFGFTDTSDYRLVKAEGKPVDVVYPDQEGIGTLVLPNTVALVKGGPNPENAKKLLRFLLSDEAERILAHHQRGHIPLKPGVDRPAEVVIPSEMKTLDVDFTEVGAKVGQRLREMNERFR